MSSGYYFAIKYSYYRIALLRMITPNISLPNEAGNVNNFHRLSKENTSIFKGNQATCMKGF